MTKNKISLYFGAISLFIASGFFVTWTNRLEIPECKHSKVQSYVITLWKIQSLKNSEPLIDGRLSEPVEEPMNVANGRACSAAIVVDGKPLISIGYTVFIPTGGDQDLVILN
jgi:hypothetical protein